MSLEKVLFIIAAIYFVTALPVFVWHAAELEPACYEACSKQGYEIVLSASIIGKPCLECTCFYKENVQIDEVITAC